MPRWLNVSWSVFILGAFGFAIYSYAGQGNTPIDTSQPWTHFKDFLIPVFSIVGFVINAAATSFFSNADLAATMLVSLLFIALALIISSVFITDAKSGSRLFEIGLAICGLALGIPFGERLRTSERKTVQSRKKVSDKEGNQGGDSTNLQPRSGTGKSKGNGKG